MTLYRIIKKEARGLGDDTDFGEAQKILGVYSITQKAMYPEMDSTFLKI